MVKSMFRLWLLLFIILGTTRNTFSQVAYQEDGGPFGVGLKTQRTKSLKGYPIQISTWYPTEKKSDGLTLEKYIRLGSAKEGVSGDSLISEFKNVVKNLYELPAIQTEQLQQVLAQKTNTQLDAPMKEGFYPALIGFSRPLAYVPVVEFLTSYGYVIITVNIQYPPDLENYSTLETEILTEILKHAENQPYVNKNDINTFGHGGGIQSALFLAMQTDKIKQVVNMDGGFFGTRSRTIQSEYFKPERLRVPLLHIITSHQLKEENEAVFNAVKNPVTRVVISDEQIRHQDFTLYGWVAATLRNRTRSLLDLYADMYPLILKFLKDEPLSNLKMEGYIIEQFH